VIKKLDEIVLKKLNYHILKAFNIVEIKKRVFLKKIKQILF